MAEGPKISKTPKAYIDVLLYCLEHYLRKGEKEEARKTKKEVLGYGRFLDRTLGTEEYEKYAEKRIAEFIGY